MIRKILVVAVLLMAAACSSGKTETGPTAQPLPAVATSPPKQTTGVLRYSFLDRYAAGAINSPAQASTPTGKGALILPWRFGPVATKSLTVLAGFRYSYPDVEIGPNDQLTFEAAKPLSVGSSVKSFVDIRDGTTTKRIFAHTLPPASSQAPTWQAFAISLKAYHGHNVTFIFGADADKGDNTGAWVAFANPGVYAGK